MMKKRLFLCVFFISSVFIGVNTYSQVFTDANVESITNGYQFTEGPIWVEDIGLLFSDIPANKIYQWTEANGASEYINPSGNSNGLGLDNDGNLILCQHGPRQLSIEEEDGSLRAIATHYDGKRLNSPNDLTFHSNGSILFTDPPYGLNDQGGTSELGYSGIYRLATNGIVYLLDNTLDYPNGICFSPDESLLYVNDSQDRDIFVWDVVDDTTIVNKRLFAAISTPGNTDGMKVDADGYLYCTGPVGIHIYAPDGTLVNAIPVPGQTTNCCWGPDGTTMYVTSGNTVYRLTKKEEPNSLIETGINQDESAQVIYNYPNPFKDETSISFNLEVSSNVKLSVIDMLGKPVIVLLDEHMSEGNYNIVWNSGDIAKGMFIIVLEASGKKYTHTCCFAGSNS